MSLEADWEIDAAIGWSLYEREEAGGEGGGMGGGYRRRHRGLSVSKRPLGRFAGNEHEPLIKDDESNFSLSNTAGNGYSGTGHNKYFLYQKYILLETISTSWIERFGQEILVASNQLPLHP